MSSNNNININIQGGDSSKEISSQTLSSVEDNSSKYLLGSVDNVDTSNTNLINRNSQKLNNSSFHFGEKFEEPKSMLEEEDFLSAALRTHPGYINIPTNNPNPIEIENLSPVIEPSVFFSSSSVDTRSKIVKNFYNDICIPLHKINGDRDLEEFYKVDYEKFQQFCDKPFKVKSVVYKTDDLNSVRRRKSTHHKTNNKDSYKIKKVDSGPLNITKKIEVVYLYIFYIF